MEEKKEESRSIKTWSEDERPREKLAAHGAEVLSNSELLAILIGSGHREKSAVEVAKEILLLGNNSLSSLSKMNLSKLQSVKGIGSARAITIAAALELGRRRQSEPLKKVRLTNATDVAEYLQNKYQDYTHEVFVVVYLNQSNKVLMTEEISAGGITGTVADTSVIMRKALEHRAKNLILCHNHPSGALVPSRADKELTEKIRQAALLFEIRVLDHVIVSDEGFFSFASEGII